MPASRTKKAVLPQEIPLVVGIGASAGGVDALHDVLGAIPQNCPIAFVIHLHIDATAIELLVESVGKLTPLPVVEIKNGTRLQPGHVYIIPGHHIASLRSGEFTLAPAESPEQRRNPIDKFFYSLARDQAERAVAVVLSGNGDDGALGIKEVSKAGGMTLVQAPATAKHEEMPQNALETGAVDHVLAPVSITEEVLAYAEHMKHSGKKEQFEQLHAQVDDYLPKICDRLLEVTGHNFKHYKVSTLSRRIHRRIQVLRLHSAQEYLARLKKDEAETHRLFNDLLIGVTAFFRDPEAFDSLVSEVLAPLFDNSKTGDVIRIWAAGCSTGEEAFTLAMLCREQLDRISHTPEVQIFATDIDLESLNFARKAVYPAGISAEVTPERLKRFFVKKAQHYHVSKEIRSLVLFSLHNLINDPPFSKLDMISCRNLLIYLGSHLQKETYPAVSLCAQARRASFPGPVRESEQPPRIVQAGERQEPDFAEIAHGGAYLRDTRWPQRAGDVRQTAQRALQHRYRYLHADAAHRAG